MKKQELIEPFLEFPDFDPVFEEPIDEEEYRTFRVCAPHVLFPDELYPHIQLVDKTDRIANFRLPKGWRFRSFGYDNFLLDDGRTQWYAYVERMNPFWSAYLRFTVRFGQHARCDIIPESHLPEPLRVWWREVKPLWDEDYQESLRNSSNSR